MDNQNIDFRGAMKLLICITSIFLLYGCAAPNDQPPMIVQYVSAEFDRAQAERQLEPGNEMISGSAFLLQRGGGVVTCAGRNVILIPYTEYSSERLSYIYGKSLDNLRRPVARELLRISPDPPEYMSLSRSSTCDAQGKFSFPRVKPGTYFMVGIVTWDVGGATQGGQFAKRVEVVPGISDPVIFTRPQ